MALPSGSASYERDGRWAAAVALPEERLVDAEAAARHAGLDDGVVWSSARAIVGQDQDRIARLAEAAGRWRTTAPWRPPTSASARRCPTPRRSSASGSTTARHAAEASLEEPEVPLMFAKFPNVLIGAGAPIELPESNAERVDYEGEIAVVIGRRAYGLSERDAHGAVAGWMPFNDVSARDLQTQTSQWTVGKSPDTFGPVRSPSRARSRAARRRPEIETAVNGEQVQHAHTDQMIFSAARLIAFLTSRSSRSSPGTSS